MIHIGEPPTKKRGVMVLCGKDISGTDERYMDWTDWQTVTCVSCVLQLGTAVQNHFAIREQAVLA